MQVEQALKDVEKVRKEVQVIGAKERARKGQQGKHARTSEADSRGSDRREHQAWPAGVPRGKREHMY